MHPVLVLGPLPFLDATIRVPSYLLVRVLYLLAAPWVAVRLTAPLGIRPRDTLAMFLIGVPAGLVGAHALAVLEPGGAADGGLLDVWHGRSAIFGGFAAGIATAAGYAAWRGISIRRLLDGYAPVMALGEGMTRLGCFLAGCCWGKRTTSPLALTFPPRSAVFSAELREGLVTYASPHSLPVHPTQLYAAAFAFVLCIALIQLLRRRRGFDGAVFCVFLASYAMWRFALAYLRDDGGPTVALGLVSSQLWSVVAIVFVLCFASVWRRGPRRGAEALAFSTAAR
jgi:phosphatidylglycerol:prolipoprotein diacylglycerol transferase